MLKSEALFCMLKSEALFGGCRYEPSRFARDNLLSLSQIALVSQPSAPGVIQGCPDNYALILLMAGSAVINTGAVPAALKAGEGLIYMCGAQTPCLLHAERAEARLIVFSGAPMQAVFARCSGGADYCALHKGCVEKCALIWQALSALARQPSEKHDIVIHGLLTALVSALLQASCAAPAAGARENDSRISELKLFIDANCCRRLSLDEIAGRLYLNKYYLARLFKSNCGVTLWDYICQKRIERAQTELRTGGKSVKTIAAACGFNDIHYFSRMFKRFTGVSPTEYRSVWG